MSVLFHMCIFLSEILEQLTKSTNPSCYILTSCLFLVIAKGSADRPAKLGLSWKVGPEWIWYLQSDAIS